MIELETRDNIAFRHLEHFDDVINPDADKSSALPYPIPMMDLLPDTTGSFFRYNGSLTTPGCNEDVIWTVFDTPIAISERQVNYIDTRESCNYIMNANFRFFSPYSCASSGNYTTPKDMKWRIISVPYKNCTIECLLTVLKIQIWANNYVLIYYT